jgi:hypothetical protein
MTPAPSCGSASTSAPSSPSTTVASACTAATPILAAEGGTAFSGVCPVQSSGSGVGGG